jgi:hypothetical protein
VNQRLEQCAVMIEKGSDYQALQLAETEPELLDMAGQLAFSEMREWAEFCQQNQLSVPEKIDAKGVTILNELYSKGISANHPLYRDYRAAVSSRDDSRALQIIKTITRLNPSDANAKTELTRLENKNFQKVRGEMKSAVEQHDDVRVVGAVNEIERLAGPAKLSEVPEYPAALEIRKKLLCREAIEQTKQLLPRVEAARAAGDWQRTGEAVGRIRALQREHKFELTPDGESTCKAAQAYYEECHRLAVKAARFDEALSGLGETLNHLDNKRLSRSGRELTVLEDDYLTLTKRWRDVESFGKPVAEDLQTRVRRTATILKTEIDRVKRRRNILVGTTAAVIAVALAFGAWLVFQNLQARDYAGQLTSLMAARQVEPVEKLTANILQDRKRLTSVPALSAKIEEAQTWSRAERQKRADVDKLTSLLQNEADSHFANADPAELASQIEMLTQNIAGLAQDLQPQPSAILADLKDKADERFSSQRSTSEQAIEDSLQKLEPEVAQKLSFDLPIDVLATAVQQLDPELAKLGQLCNPSLAALRPSESLVTRAAILQKRLDSCKQELFRIQKIREQIGTATSLEAYRTALQGYQDSLLLQADEVQAARRLLVSFPKPDDVLMNLLMPGDPVGWAGVKNDGGTLMPGDVLPGELSDLLALRDDDNLRDIWEATVVDHEHSGATNLIYSQGEIKAPVESSVGDWNTLSWTGKFYDPHAEPEMVEFTQSEVKVAIFSMGGKRYQELTNVHRSAASVGLAALSLNYMTDEGGTKYETPILHVLDDLVRQKDAGILFRAYVLQQLRAFVGIRPYSWGVQYSPSLRKDLDSFGNLLGDVHLRSTDWMQPQRNHDLGPKLAGFINGLTSRSYFAQAQLNRQLIKAAVDAGLHFAGYVGPDGKKCLLGEATGQKCLIMVGSDGLPFVTEGVSSTVGNPALQILSPIFYVPVDPAKLTQETANRLGVRADSSGIEDGLPPFFRTKK